MAQRSAELVRLGSYLRDLARREDIAIVVANQVADRFSGLSGTSIGTRASVSGSQSRSVGTTPVFPRNTQSSPLARRSHHGPDLNADVLLPSSSVPEPRPTPTQSAVDAVNIPSSAITVNSAARSTYTTRDPLSLDHQQRWFTGWGDDPFPPPSLARNMKTPSLGLIWTTQIATRIALIKRPVYGRPPILDEEGGGGGEPVLKRWKRWMKVVYAPHVRPSGVGVRDCVEFEILGAGIRGVEKGKRSTGSDSADEDEDEGHDTGRPV